MHRSENILLSLAVLALFALFLLIIFGENGFSDLQAQRLSRDELRAKNAELAKENLHLHRTVHRLKDDPKFVEAVARKELGVIGDTEFVFTLTGGELDSISMD
jgi:cell division protein FtsB